MPWKDKEKRNASARAYYKKWADYYRAKSLANPERWRARRRSTEKGRQALERQQHKLTALSKSRENGFNLYVIENRVQGIYKVGRASDPKLRAKGLAGGQWYTPRIILDLPGFGKYEQEVHGILRPWNYNPEGRMRTEWYKIPKDELVQKVLEHCSRYEH